jgi:hypothetical protein
MANHPAALQHTQNGWQKKVNRHGGNSPLRLHTEIKKHNWCHNNPNQQQDRENEACSLFRLMVGTAIPARSVLSGRETSIVMFADEQLEIGHMCASRDRSGLCNKQPSK